MTFEKQLSVFVQNKVGSLGEISNALAKAGVNIIGITIADDFDWGIVRIVVNDVDKAKEAFKAMGQVYGESTVIAVEVPNRPGVLAELANLLAKRGVGIEYAYATGTTDQTLLILSTTDDKKAAQVLKNFA